MTASTHRIELVGLGLDAVREHDVVEAVVGGGGGWVCPVNLDVLRQVDESAEIRALVERATLVVADGMPLLWASRLQGAALPERIAGSSLILSVPAAAATRGRSIFLLGGNPGSADAAAARLRAEHPALEVAGVYCPPMGFEHDEEEMERIRHRVRASGADVVFVGLGFPKQERLIERLRPILPDAWFISCGISFSFVGGEVRRAPELLQRLGLEWVHRLAQEPRRLFRRYLVAGPPFVARVLIGALRGRS